MTTRYIQRKLKNKPSLTKEITVLEQNLVEKLELLGINTNILGIPSDHLNRGLSTVDWEYPLEMEIATNFSILAWKIPWTEEPRGLQSMRSQRVGHHLTNKQQQQQYHLSLIVNLRSKDVTRRNFLCLHIPISPNYSVEVGINPIVLLHHNFLL